MSKVHVESPGYAVEVDHDGADLMAVVREAWEMAHDERPGRISRGSAGASFGFGASRIESPRRLGKGRFIGPRAEGW